jgi:hypothetical protein
MTLSILLTTRNRPELLRWTVETTAPNIREPDTRLIIAVDEDDTPETKATALELQDYGCVEVSIMPREDTLGAKVNRVLTIAPADVYLHMADYRPHLTPGFDTKILEAASLFPDNIGVVYSHMANLSFPEISAVTSGLVKHMGYLYPPYFPYWFVDHWLDDIARLIGRIAVADVETDGTRRPGTGDRRDVAWWATFFDAGVLHRRQMAHAIINSDEFQEPEWRKQILRTHHPLIEERSKMINDSARTTRWQFSPEAVDERYRRAKSAAQALLREWIPELEAEHAKVA